MVFDLELMKSRVLDIVDTTNPYTQEDFNKEFGGPNINPDLYKINFSFANKSTNEDPSYATNGSSGFDLRANLVDGNSIILLPHDRVIVPTGLFFNIPENFEIQIRARSGLAAKNGITVLNAPGTIDADYRGEIKVILINHSDERFIITHGDRIAQAIIASVIAKNSVNLIKVDDVSNDTERGTGGLGSTGLH